LDLGYYYVVYDSSPIPTLYDASSENNFTLQIELEQFT